MIRLGKHLYVGACSVPLRVIAIHEGRCDLKYWDRREQVFGFLHGVPFACLREKPFASYHD